MLLDHHYHSAPALLLRLRRRVRLQQRLRQWLRLQQRLRLLSGISYTRRLRFRAASFSFFIKHRSSAENAQVLE